MAVEPSNQTNQNKGAAFRAVLSHPISTITNTLAPLRKEPPLPTQPAMGFFTDTSLCIGCKACEVACKQWNQLPAMEPDWTGNSYDNTGQLSAITWRHVQFIEQIGHTQPSLPPPLPLFKNNVTEARTNGTIPETPPGTALPFFNTDRWLMQSDVCKHCANAPCQEACPTGAIIRTEFDTVYVQQDICNGCGYCIVACPFGVIARDEQGDHRAHKCTLCYDRLIDGLEPACAKACPTDSIQFGDLGKLRERARTRVQKLRDQGLPAYVYGDSEVGGTNGIGDLQAFFLLLDKPAKYNLPENPQLPQRHTLPGVLSLAAAAVALGAATAWSLWKE